YGAKLRPQWAQESTITYMTKRYTKRKSIRQNQHRFKHLMENESRKTGFSTSTGGKRPQPGSRSSSKDRSKLSKSFNFGFEPKHIDKENISQTDLLQEILERLNHLEISRNSSLKVACHNLNCLKRNNQKLCTLLEWAEEDRIN
ncbi:9225_t:CDS:2, partial [Gigaspora rosea]